MGKQVKFSYNLPYEVKKKKSSYEVENTMPSRRWLSWYADKQERKKILWNPTLINKYFDEGYFT